MVLGPAASLAAAPTRRRTKPASAGAPCRAGQRPLRSCSCRPSAQVTGWVSSTQRFCGLYKYRSVNALNIARALSEAANRTSRSMTLGSCAASISACNTLPKSAAKSNQWLPADRGAARRSFWTSSFGTTQRLGSCSSKPVSDRVRCASALSTQLPWATDPVSLHESQVAVTLPSQSCRLCQLCWSRVHVEGSQTRATRILWRPEAGRPVQWRFTQAAPCGSSLRTPSLSSCTARWARPASSPSGSTSSSPTQAASTCTEESSHRPHRPCHCSTELRGAWGGPGAGAMA
mmetsp:Transcript_93560/g.291162  ORF Transcript_93560/g.291162 Transcript_93560/m.291162 type:complete len:289 (-) Transcript_93560:8-874(-)